MINNDTLNELRQHPEDLIILASWYYKLGEPIISDFEYNALAESFGDTSILWDELEEPTELLERYNLTKVQYSTIEHNKYFNEYKEVLENASTRSIKATYTYEDAYNRMMSLCSVTDEIVMSLKVDGVSTRNILENDNNEWNLVASLSRSRESTGFDYTDGMVLAVDKDLTFEDNAGCYNEARDKKVIFVFGEAYVERTALTMLREKYGMGDTWKTPRSTALSMLRKVIEPEDYKYLKLKCFKLDVGNTLTDMFNMAEKAGLDVVPYECVKCSDIPKEYDKWKVWFDSILSKYKDIQDNEDIEADGIVISINNQIDFNNQGTSTDGKYNNAAFSCKFGPWGSVRYVSKIVKIHFDNIGNTSEFSVVAEIEPVVVNNGNTVTRVNCFNPKILIDNKLNIGSYIQFEYKSASSVNLIYS